MIATIILYLINNKRKTTKKTAHKNSKNRIL